MEKTLKKTAALISRDKPTVKLINFMLDNSDISTELVLSAAELNETSAKKDSPPPNLIIYDSDASRQGEEHVCQPLKEYRHYDKTPKVVMSTFKVDCGSCTGFKHGKCAHIQKPFKITKMINVVNELVFYKLSD